MDDTPKSNLSGKPCKEDRDIWPAPFGPMGTPEIRHYNKTLDLIERYRNLTHAAGTEFYQHERQIEVEQHMSIVLNQVVNLPQAPNLKLCFISKESRDLEISVTQCSTRLNTSAYPDKPFPRPRPFGKPCSLGQIVSHIAMRYRESFAVHQFIDLGHTIMGLPRHESTNDKTIGIPILNEEGQVLKHPARLLDDPDIVGQSFINTYHPGIVEAPTKLPWMSDPISMKTVILLFSKFPEIIAQSAEGTPLAKLIELPGEAMKKLEPHAIKAWNSVIINNIDATNSIAVIALEPTHQISWPAPMVDTNHMPTSAIDQASINIARCAGMV